MNIKPNLHGLYNKSDVYSQSVVPIVDFVVNNASGLPNLIDLWTYSDLKDVFGYKLNSAQRVSMIKGFIRYPRMRGFAPLYSLNEVLELFEGWSIKYIFNNE